MFPKPLALVSFLLLNVIIGLGLACHSAAADEFSEAIQRLFELPPTAQIVWPPRRGLAAGAVIDPALRVLAIAEGNSHSVPTHNDAVTISLPDTRLRPPSGFWIWRKFLAHSEQLNVRLSFSDPESATWTAGKSEELFVRKPDPTKLQAGPSTATVTRAWSARATLEISPKGQLSTSDWLAMRKEAQSDTTGTVKFGRTANSLLLTAPEKVVLAIDPAVREAKRAPGQVAGPRRWALATIASGRYQFLAGMDQEWNAQSADVVAEALADWRPTTVQSLKPADDDGLARQGVLAFLDGFLSEAKQTKAEMLVVYYVGHMERTGTGSLSLLMGDAPSVRQIRAPAPSTDIGNLRDLMQVVDQAEAELAPRPGSLDVAVMHRFIGKAGIPFVLLVDGCLEDPSYAAARERLGIVVDAHGGEPLYVGPGDAGTALREQLEQLRNYPQDFPWLKSREATVLGATPGTLAYAEAHPVWALGGPVGPIARRLFDIAARTRWDADRPNLIRVLGFSADRQPIGPQELVGTVSWSDWLPHLKRFDSQSFKRK